ncbi:MAG: hypothetical protein ACRDTG_10880 [Pseudonocardiaceae bacterium]
MAESPDALAGMRLLDAAKHHGFRFQRLAPGPDGLLWGVRDTVDWRDELYLAGFWEPDSCNATRRRKFSLLVPGELLVTEQVSGDALNVLNTVVSYWSPWAQPVAG